LPLSIDVFEAKQARCGSGVVSSLGNPTITPLVRESDAHDTILVQINPTERPETPRSAMEILNGLNEISFNSPLAKELRMIALLRQVGTPRPFCAATPTPRNKTFALRVVLQVGRCFHEGANGFSASLGVTVATSY